MGRGWMRELPARFTVGGDGFDIDAAVTARDTALNAEIGLSWLLWAAGSAPNADAVPVVVVLVAVALPFPLSAFAVILAFSDFVVAVDSKVSLASASLMSLAETSSLDFLMVRFFTRGTTGSSSLSSLPSGLLSILLLGCARRGAIVGRSDGGLDLISIISCAGGSFAMRGRFSCDLSVIWST